MHVTVTTDRITIRHQCPLCCAPHYNGRHRLCDACNRKAFAVDLLGALAVLASAALTAGAVAVVLS